MLGEPLEDGQMNEMTLPSRHGIQNTSPDGLKPSTLPLGHGMFTYVAGSELKYFLIQSIYIEIRRWF